MNTMTKVFIVLNLLVALACAYTMLVWYAISENWKRRWAEDTRHLAVQIVDANEVALQQSKERVVAVANQRTLEERITGLEADIQSKEDDIKNLKEEKAALNKTISENNTQIAHQREQVRSLNSSLKQSQTRGEQLKTIADAARAVAYELNVSLHELEDDFNNLTMENTRLKEQIHTLEEITTKQKSYLALIRENYPEAHAYGTSEKPMPPVPPALVSAVRVNNLDQQELVMITVGSKNGNVEKGMVFVIFRDGTYICKVRAEKVMDDMTACQVIRDTWNNQGAEIQQGDIATTKVW